MSVATEDTAKPFGAGASPETPSGKGAGDENFPVGSFLLPAELRPCVAAYYAFVRAADDIADNPDLPPDDKVARLDAMEAALIGAPGHEGEGFAKAHALRARLDERGVTDQHARDVLVAFRRDATKTRYADWDDLLGYCEYSANPVGRFLLDLHGEQPADYEWSDPLCTALQVVNHLQDCGDDYRELDRVYVPEQWMADEGVSCAELGGEALSPGMRRVVDRMLVATDALIDKARGLPGALSSRSLAAESSIIVRLAARLSRRLATGDPLARRISLSKADFALAGARGAIEGFLRI